MPAPYTEADMIIELRKKFTKIRPGTQADRYVRAEHVRSDAYVEHRGRIADYLVLDTYAETELLGFEVKVTRSDWLSELRNPDKAQVWRQHCHKWYLVVPDARIVKDDLPDGWGLMVLGKAGLRVRVASEVNPEPVPLPASAHAQWLRGIAQTSVRESDSRVAELRQQLAELTRYRSRSANEMHYLTHQVRDLKEQLRKARRG